MDDCIKDNSGQDEEDFDNLSSVEYINSEFVLMPNPAKGQFHVQFDEALNDLAFITIYDQLGKLILVEKVLINDKFHSIDISSFRTGIYSVVINLSNKVYSQSLMVE